MKQREKEYVGTCSVNAAVYCSEYFTFTMMTSQKRKENADKILVSEMGKKGASVRKTERNEHLGPKSRCDVPFTNSKNFFNRLVIFDEHCF